MAKKLLKEDTVRRFMKLADIQHLSNSFITEAENPFGEEEDDEGELGAEGAEGLEGEGPDELEAEEASEFATEEEPEAETADSVPLEQLEGALKAFAAKIPQLSLEVSDEEGLGAGLEGEDELEMEEPGDLEDMGEAGGEELAGMEGEEEEEEPFPPGFRGGGMKYESKMAGRVADRVAKRLMEHKSRPKQQKHLQRRRVKKKLNNVDVDKLTERVFRRLSEANKPKKNLNKVDVDKLTDRVFRRLSNASKKR
jgi:hypothetical protein